MVERKQQRGQFIASKWFLSKFYSVLNVLEIAMSSLPALHCTQTFSQGTKRVVCYWYCEAKNQQPGEMSHSENYTLQPLLSQRQQVPSSVPQRHCHSNLSKAAPSPPRRYTGSWLFHWNHLPCALYSVHCALYIRIVERERWVFFWRKCPGRALTLLTSWKILVSPVQQIQALIINFCQHWITISISFAQSSTFW